MATSLSKPKELPIIRKWSATYYHEETRKWHKGQLKLSHSLLSFHEQPSGKIDLAVDIDLIANVKIERSWLGYNTLVVLVGTGKFWFASLDSSQGVRRVLLHFIENSLLCNKNEVIGPPHKSCCSGNNGSSLSEGNRRSKFGSELLSLAHDSQRTLAEAASQLTSQGEQLDGALRTTDSLQRDLGVGSLHITHLESWLGLWHVSSKDLELRLPRHTQGDSTRLQDNSTEVTKVPVIYRLSKSLVEESGTLNVDDTSLTICDEKKREAIKFALREISTVAMTTPWSMVITRRLIGRPDISCHVTSANLLTILKALELRVKGKIEYDEPTDSAFTLPSNATQRCTVRGIELSKGRADVVSATSREGDWPIREGQQVQVTAASQSEVVTESEADELSSVLRDLKSLAVGVGNELDVQDEKITQLTEDVDSLSEGVKRSNKRMQRLL